MFTLWHVFTFLSQLNQCVPSHILSLTWQNKQQPKIHFTLFQHFNAHFVACRNDKHNLKTILKTWFEWIKCITLICVTDLVMHFPEELSDCHMPHPFSVTSAPWSHVISVTRHNETHTPMLTFWLHVVPETNSKWSITQQQELNESGWPEWTLCIRPSSMRTDPVTLQDSAAENSNFKLTKRIPYIIRKYKYSS